MHRPVSRAFFVLFIPIFWAWSSCADKQQEVIRSFYHWQTTLDLSTEEIQELSSLGVHDLYVKYFDVIWDEEAAQPRPVAKLQTVQVPDELSIHPVIFLTNETLEHLDMDGVNDLAWRMCKLMDQIHTGLSKDPPAIIQIDCDWTESTRDKYFQLLKQMQTYKRFEETIWSATIRLHQYAYPQQTGVPPVDRGLLMFYNMGNIEDPDAAHSIYDPSTAEAYLKQTDHYPIPLDAGIALFSWGLYFHHRELQQIFYPLYADELLNESLFTQVDDNHFAAAGEGYFRGRFVQPGDTIRIESMSPELGLKSAEQLSHYLHDHPLSVILYHTDPVILQHYTHEELDSVFSAFE